MAAALVVKHRVADFDAWKKVFDSMISVRKEHGWTAHIVLRDASDPNVVMIVNRVRDVESAKRYAGSPELRAGMQKAGVQGPPDIWFMEDAGEHAY